MLKRFDMFSRHISFKVSGKDTFQTSTGAYLTLISCFMSAFLFIYIIYTMMFERSGSFVIYTQPVSRSTPFNLTIGEDITLIVNFVDENFRLITVDKTLMDISLQNWVVIYNETTKGFIPEMKKRLEIMDYDETSRMKYFNSIDTSQYQGTEKELIFLNTSLNNDFRLGGGVNSEIYSVTFTIKPKESTEANSTLMERYYNIVSKAKVLLILSYKIPQVLNISQPFTRSMKIVTTNFGYFTTTYLQEVNLNSSESIIPGMPGVSYSFPTITESDNKIDDKSKYKQVTLDFQLLESTLHVNRVYDTFDLYLAKFTSLNSTFIMIFNLLSNYLTSLNFKVYLFNRFFKFNDEENKKVLEEKVGLQRAKTVRKKSVGNKGSPGMNIQNKSSIYVKENVSKEELVLAGSLIKSFDEAFAFKQQEEETFSEKFIEDVINYYNFVQHKIQLPPCGKKKTHVDTYNMMDGFFNDLISVESVLKTMIEFRKFKKLILKEYQQKVFEKFFFNAYSEQVEEPLEKEKLKEIFDFAKNRFESTINERLVECINKELTTSYNL